MVWCSLSFPQLSISAVGQINHSFPCMRTNDGEFNEIGPLSDISCSYFPCALQFHQSVPSINIIEV